MFLHSLYPTSISRMQIVAALHLSAGHSIQCCHILLHSLVVVGQLADCMAGYYSTLHSHQLEQSLGFASFGSFVLDDGGVERDI
jgi:hypothetical protein